MNAAQLDSRFDDHPKYAECDAEEMGLIACSITYANRNLTDGIIPRVWPERRFPGHGNDIAGRLVTKGIWRRLPDGRFEVVGFLDHNPSREAVQKSRAEAANRKTAAKVARDALTATTSEREAPRTLPGMPEPEPVPAKRATRLKPDWRPQSATVAWCASQGVDAEACVPEFVDYWVSVADQRGLRLDWDAAFRNRVRELIRTGKAPVLKVSTRSILPSVPKDLLAAHGITVTEPANVTDADVYDVFDGLGKAQ